MSQSQSEILLALPGEMLESSLRNWFASLLVSAKGGCEWASENLRDQRSLEANRREDVYCQRALTAASHWRWVFMDSSDFALPFGLVCEELGLSESAVRRRIMAQCSPNRDINTLVSEVLRADEEANADHGE